jgi:translation initiation factor 2B subunit (eIF-2B alpha/beta/delta family)
MLFDLRGRRRRAVQVTYLFLALLMGGGLVLFGVGGSVSGGLLDAFKGGGGGSSGDSAIRDKVKKEEERLAKTPQNEAVLQNLVRDYYSLATSQRQSGAVGFPADAKDELRKADQYWQRYVNAAKGDPSPDAANVALQLYGPTALNKPKELVKAGSILAKDSNDAASYLRLVSYAALANDTRTADLAAKKAVDLAPKSQRKLVKQQAETIKKQAQQQKAQQQQPGG